MGKFSGKVALVTGASSGIGRATALALAKEGADVALNFWTLSENAESAALEIQAMGRKAVLCQVDVSQQDHVEKMVADIVAKLGRLNMFVSSHVYSDRAPFTTADMAEFRKTIDVSMWGTYYCLRAAANQMLKQGQGGDAVIVSSPHATIPFPNCMAYNMAKAAQDSMAKSAAIELLPHKIRVNLIHPGWTDTHGERKFFSEEALAKGAKATPMGRLGKPEEIAHGILFLLDPMSAYMTGATLVMDGGLALPWWSKRGKDGDF